VLSAKLGIKVQAGDEKLSADDLTSTMMARATKAGKTQK